METPAHRVQLVQAESAQLAHDLHALPPEAWRRPSACDRWEVRDVVGHLILGAELYQSVISRGLQGNTAPLEGFPQAGTVNAASAAPLFDQMSVARRESLGDQLLSTFTATSDQLHQILARCGPQDWETLCYHPAGVLPVRLFVALRLSELVMHGWDIRSRLEPDAHLGPAGGKLRPDLIKGSRLSVPTFGTGNIVGKWPFKSPFWPLKPKIIPVPSEVGNRC